MLSEHLKHTSWDQLHNGEEFHADEVAKIVHEAPYVLELFDFNNNLLARMRCSCEDHLLDMHYQVLHEVKKFNQGVVEEDNTVCPYWDWE